MELAQDFAELGHVAPKVVYSGLPYSASSHASITDNVVPLLSLLSKYAPKTLERQSK